MNLCKICKEPISNFICIDCLEREISERIPEKLRGKFLDFHRSLSTHFSSKTSRFIPCLKCKLSNAPYICIPCYLNEVHSWFRENRLLGKLRRNLSFNFEGVRKGLKSHSALPITETENHKERDGICDECGEYSGNLVIVNSEWVCEGCRNLMGEIA